MITLVDWNIVQTEILYIAASDSHITTLTPRRFLVIGELVGSNARILLIPSPAFEDKIVSK